MLDSIRGQPLPDLESPVGVAVPEHLVISLKSVLDRLPAALKPLATRSAHPEETLCVPMARVLPQLSTGAVRITFDEFRAAAPAGLFDAAGRGDALVDLPLPEILRVAGPLLKRKLAQKAEPAAGSFFARLAPPAAASPAQELAPAVPPAPMSAAPVFAPALQRVKEDLKSGTTFTTFQPTPTPLEPTSAAPGAFEPIPPPTVGVVPVKLAVLTEHWPETIRKEAAALGDVTVKFPHEELGNAMKSGKVTFSWGQLRSWMNPAVGSSPAGNTTLTLPLRALVQPFMSTMKSGAKPTAAADRSPAVFVNLAKPSNTTFPVAPPAAPVPTDTKLGEALGEADKAHWTPAEMIRAVIAIPGVFGAMLSLQEGQLAAAEMRVTLPPELLSYALPKLFSATGDQARLMKLGDPTMISLVADGHHWAVFKLERLFFTVVSRKGHWLPLPQLQIIATEIARQRK